jgi:hypothetical protein
MGKLKNFVIKGSKSNKKNFIFYKLETWSVHTAQQFLKNKLPHG